jgi:hypothetical protein
MTWDGHWGHEVDYQYQHYRHHLQLHDLHRLGHHCAEPNLDQEGDVMVQEQTSNYNRISVLAIAPQKLLPMIISQVAHFSFLFLVFIPIIMPFKCRLFCHSSNSTNLRKLPQ